MAEDEIMRDADLSSSSSDDSDFQDVEVSEADMNLIIELESRLEKNAADYDAYVQFIEVLRRCNMKERLKEVRRAMNDRFPLSEALWLDWINDELDEISGEEDIPKIEALLEAAHKDYLSIPLWVQHLELVKNLDPGVQSGTPEALSRFRDLCERALTAGGLHIPEGHKLWTIYLNFELGQEENASDDSQREEAAERVRALYRRLLAVPLEGSTDTFAAYEAWEKERKGDAEDEIMPKHVKRAYDVAQRALDLRQPFEESIATAAGPTELLSSYLAYIKIEESSNDPSRVQLMYERAVSAFPVTHFLWLQYGRYIESVLKDTSAAAAVYERGVRNCPWVGELWERLLRLKERAGESQEAQDAVYKAAIVAGLQGPEDLILVTLARIDSLRREHSKEALEKLREICSAAVSMLESNHSTYFDVTLRLPAYWAQCEATLCGQSSGSGNSESGGEDAVEAGRQVWESALKSAQGAAGRYSATWLGYVEFEREYGSIENARAVFKRCFARGMEGIGQMEVCHAWLRFEREHGDAEDYFNACLKVEPVLAKIAVATGASAAAAGIGEGGAGAGAGKKTGDRKQQSEISKEEARLLRQQNDPNYGKKKRKEPEKETNKRGKVAEEDMPAPVSKKAKADAEPAEQPAGGVQGAQGAPAAADQDFAARRAVTAFVKHLPESATEDSLRELFSPCGPIALIKLGIDRSTGRHKGFAFVEFSTSEALEAACKLNGTEIEDKKLFVAPSNPPAAGGAGAGRGRGRGGGGRGGRGRGGSAVHPRGHIDLGAGGRGGGGDAAAPSSKPRSGLGFVPRAAVVQKKQQGGQEAGDAPKSNADFRKMLLEKKK